MGVNSELFNFYHLLYYHLSLIHNELKNILEWEANRETGRKNQITHLLGLIK